MPAPSEWQFEAGVAGFGFLALAVMIFGQWKPHRIALAALLFGLFRALASVYSGFDFLLSLQISGSIYKMLPYIISLIVLALTSKRSRAPKAEASPTKRDKDNCIFNKNAPSTDGAFCYSSNSFSGGYFCTPHMPMSTTTIAPRETAVSFSPRMNIPAATETIVARL